MVANAGWLLVGQYYAVKSGDSPVF